VSTDVVLQWVTGTNAVERRVWFGTTAPGGDLGVQTADLLARTGLAPLTTYYWRVDEMTSGGGVTLGPVWSFTTAAPPGSGATLSGLWLFDRQNDPGHATIGTDLQIEGTVPGWSAGVSDEAGAQVRGVILTASGPTNHLRALHGIAPNGGGNYVNRYSVVMDILSPPASRSLYRSLIQTQTANSNDGDYFLRDSDSRVGVFDLTYGPAVDGSRWTRLVFTVDLQSVTLSSVLRTYLDGGAPYTHTAQPLDQRFSLDPSVLFFADEDGENPPLYVGMLAVYNGPLSSYEVAALGGVRAEGLFAAPQPTIEIIGGTARAAWPATPGYLLQYSDDLLLWNNISSTTGLGEWMEPIHSGKRFFRTLPR
jgi:hypothetical protein